MKRACIITQLGYHGGLLCQCLGIGREDFYGYPRVPPDHMYKLIILLGVYCNNPLWESAIASVKGSKLLCYWVGTDILLAKTYAGHVTAVDSDHTIHWTQRPANKAELAEVGVEADIVPLPVQTDRFRPAPLPDDKVVGNYQPRLGISPVDYHLELTLEVAKIIPQWKFRIVSPESEPKGQLAANISHIGHVDDMPGEYEKWSHVMRFTSHDGLPKTLVEAILIGRSAVANIEDMPGVRACMTLSPSKVVEALYDARPPSDEVITYWRTVCDPLTWSIRISSLAE